jgi:CzcA family heavy metal efflux pump
MFLVRTALGNVYGVIVMALVISILGAVSLTSIPVDILPAFKVPAVQVLTYFNGMPARSIERTITDRVERWVNQSPGVSQVESRSVAGVSVVKLYFREDTDPNAALTMSSSLADAARPYLPTNTLPPVVLPFDPTGTLPLGILTVSNPSMAEQEVKDLARVEVRNRLGSIGGAVAPVVVGGKDRRVMIYLDPQKLEARNLSPTDVVKALDLGNIMASPGAAYFGDSQIALDTNSMVREVADLNDMPITFGPDRQVVLRDVGTAIDDAVIQKSRVRVNGKPQVFVPIYRQAGASSLAVADGVRAAVPEMESELPEGSKLEFVIDQSEYVRKSIESLVHEGIVGAVLVSIMIFLFLGEWRMTLIACLSLPLSILGAIIGLQTTGNTINVMTLGGLFLAIGPLIDNAIVVLENIHRHLGMGKTPFQAALDATGELTMPVIVATLALIIVLCPVALTPGVGGFLFKPLTLAVAFAMVASFLLSWTFVPSLCSVMLRGHGHHDPKAHGKHSVGFFGMIHHGFDAVITAINRVYVGLLAVALRNRILVLAGVALVFLGSFTLVPGIGQEFFPAVDAGQISLQVRAPSHLRLDATERRIIDVEAAIAEAVPPHELQMVVSEIGLNNDWSAAYSANAGQQDTVIRLQLTPERTKSAQEYAIVLRKHLAADPRFADLEFSFDTGGMVSAALNFGASSPIDVQVIGGTPDQKFEAAAKVRKLVAEVPGTADVRVLQRNDAPYLMIEVDRQKAAGVGLSAKDVVMQVVTAMNSSIALTRNFWIDPKSGNQYFVAVQYPDNPSFRVDDLKNVIATGTGAGSPAIRLNTLVTVRPTTQPVEFNHDGLKRVVDVLVNTEGRDIGAVAGDVKRKLAGLELPAGMRVELRGEYARMRESFDSLAVGLALASVLVYLLMVPLMRSFVMPLIIMATVPLGLIGVLVMLYTTGTTLNVQSEMGVIFLVGIVVSQGVLLMDFANQLRKQGRTVHEAITQAAAIRFRPILMTFLATFLDLLPMAIGLGRGSEALTPLARTVVGGLVSATVLTLFVVPVLFTLLIRDKHHQPGHHEPTH